MELKDNIYRFKTDRTPFVGTGRDVSSEKYPRTDL